MKITPRQIASFLTKPAAGITAVLFHGNDLGMISERAKQFAHLFSDNLDDVFSVTRLTGDMLSGEAGLIADSAAAIPAFVTAILKDSPPTIYGDGEQSRDFTYIDNVVQANLLAARAEKTQGQTVNIACGQAVTVNQIIEMINNITGRNVKPIYVDRRPGDVKHSLADITAAKELIGYTPVVPFKQGLKDAIDWYRDNLL